MRNVTDYDQDVRNNATSELITALLNSCPTKAERISLAVKLLGYDPRIEDSKPIPDFNL